MAEKREMGFVVAAKKYFADDMKATQFIKELKELTPQDKEDLRPHLERELGVKIAKAA